MAGKHRVGDWGAIFGAVRALTAAPGLRHVMVVRQNQSLLCLPCPERSTVRPEYIANVERIVPSEAKRNIAVIAPTQPKLEPTDGDAVPGALDVIAMRRVIPFFRMLIGLLTIGHSVWIFEGHADALVAG